MSFEEKSGSCLCKAVQITAKIEHKVFEVCHCGMCRKWAGAPAMVLEPTTEVTFDDANNITVYESSEWAERGFCKTCGSNIFYRLKEDGRYFLQMGLFDETDGFEFKKQIFIDHKPDNYSFADKTETMTEAEVFEN